MKKLLMILVVMALLMAFPVAAVAKKPAQPPGQEPFPGLTCQAWFESHDDTLWQVGVFPITDPADSADIVDCSDADGPCFSLKLEDDHRAACIDVTSLEGVWEFKVVDAVGVASFNMQIKDSVPGDMCWRDAWRKTKKADLPDSLSTPGAIPEATFDACPGDDFSDEAESLVFMVGYSPERRAEDSSLTITVTLP